MRLLPISRWTSPSGTAAVAIETSCCYWRSSWSCSDLAGGSGCRGSAGPGAGGWDSAHTPGDAADGPVALQENKGVSYFADSFVLAALET